MASAAVSSPMFGPGSFEALAGGVANLPRINSREFVSRLMDFAARDSPLRASLAAYRQRLDFGRPLDVEALQGLADAVPMESLGRLQDIASRLIGRVSDGQAPDLRSVLRMGADLLPPGEVRSAIKDFVESHNPLGILSQTAIDAFVNQLPEELRGVSRNAMRQAMRNYGLEVSGPTPETQPSPDMKIPEMSAGAGPMGAGSMGVGRTPEIQPSPDVSAGTMGSGPMGVGRTPEIQSPSKINTLPANGYNTTGDVSHTHGTAKAMNRVPVATVPEESTTSEREQPGWRFPQYKAPATMLLRIPQPKKETFAQTLSRSNRLAGTSENFVNLVRTSNAAYLSDVNRYNASFGGRVAP